MNVSACTCTVGAAWCGKCGCENNPKNPGRRADGERCGAQVLPAAHRCIVHGGQTAPARHKAAEALAKLRMPAIEALIMAIQTAMMLIERYTSNMCLHCGLPKIDVEESEVLVKNCLTIAKMAESVLDRTDLGPKATLEVKQDDGVIDIGLCTDDEKRELMEHLVAVQAIKEGIRRRLAGLPITPSQPAIDTSLAAVQP